MRKSFEKTISVGCRCVVLTLSIALCGACMLYRWEPYYVAYGWSKEGKPVLLQWIGTGYQVTVGHGISATPTTGHYRVIRPEGTAYDFTIPSFGMCYYPKGPLPRWYKLVDEHSLIVVGPACGGGSVGQRAVLYNMSNNVIERNLELPLPPNYRFDSDISDDLSVLALSSSDGITVVELSTGAQRKFLPGRRARSISLSHDGRQLAALVRFAKDDVTILPFKEKFADTSLHNDSWHYDSEQSPLPSYYVGLLVMDVTSGAIIDIYPPNHLKTDTFVDETYRQLRPLEYNFERPMRDFCFSKNMNELILQDTEKHFTYGGAEYVMWRGPYCSSNPKRIGFYRQVSQDRQSEGKPVSLFWLSQETGTISQVERP